MHSLLRPYLLRREKEDVETSLPPREETLITVEMTPLQRQVYRALYDKNYLYVHLPCELPPLPLSHGLTLLP